MSDKEEDFRMKKLTVIAMMVGCFCQFAQAQSLEQAIAQTLTTNPKIKEAYVFIWPANTILMRLREGISRNWMLSPVSVRNASRVLIAAIVLR